MVTTLNVNGSSTTVDVPSDMPLLWILRDVLNLRGTKYGCGIGQCGACTVHLDGEPARSCQVSVSAATGPRITTIEGLSPNGSPGATGLAGVRRAAMWLLPGWAAHVCGGLARWCGIRYSPDQLVTLAMNLEARTLGIPTGVQIIIRPCTAVSPLLNSAHLAYTGFRLSLIHI